MAQSQEVQSRVPNPVRRFGPFATMRAAVIGALVFLAALPAANAEEGDRTITKVIKLLQGMMVKSKADGEQDTVLFAKYKCYCDSNTNSKTKAIDQATKSIALLGGEIAELQASNGAMSTDNAQLEFSRGENERARETATELRDKANADFKEEKADMEAAIEQMNTAIDTLSAIGADQTAAASLVSKGQFLGKEAKKAALLKVQSSVQNTVKAAALFLPQKQQKALTAFIQAPFTGTYTSQSGEIVGILKNMRDTFKSNLASAIASEKSSLESYEVFTKVKVDEHAKQKASFEDKEKIMVANDDALSTKKTTKGETETSKADDEEFLAKLIALCAKKTKEYEDRKMIRANEEAAVAQAVSILNSDAAFDTLGATKAATEGETGFLQMRSRTQRKSARELVLRELTRAARRTKSLRLAKIAAMIEGGNPFDKICGEVEKMVALITKEENQDHEQFDWCNSERESNHEQKTEKQDMIDGLNEKVAELVDIIDNEETGLKALLAEENAKLAENQKDQADETEDRSAENAAYQKNVHNLVEAEKILSKATKVLQKFYDWLHAKTGPHHYEEKAGKDAGGGNMKRIPEASTADPEEKWNNSPGTLYVKVYDTENPVGLAQLSSKAREDPAPPSEEFSETGSEAGADAVGMLSFLLKETEAEEKAAHEDEES